MPLNVPINTWNVYVRALTGTMEDVTIQVSRALSKLKQVYSCFVRDPTDIGVETGQHRNIKNPHCSEWYLPRGATPKLRMQVGARQFPLKGDCGESNAIGEFLYRLELSSGSWNSEVNSHGLCREAYLDPHERAFIACIDMEKIISGDDDIDFSGLSLRDNPHVVINWKGLRGTGTGTPAVSS